MAEFSFFQELRKRKVLQSAAIYGAIAWGVTEVVVTIVEQLYLPPWISTLAVIFFVVGFPVAMFLAWTFDFTAEGIQRTSVASRRGTASIVVSMALLIAGTAGLFFLIKPGIQERVIASEMAAVPVQPNSLAVLPFVNAGGNPEESYIVGGLSDQLRDQLARISGLRIAARSSSVAAVEQGLDAVASSSRLGVAYLVEGSVWAQGNVLRVSVQLINGQSGLADWSQTFERGPRELLTVQQAIAEAVVAQVLPETTVAISEPGTRDPTANEFMLLARHYEQQVRERQTIDESTLLEAVRLYREATKSDPESALAHSRLAGVLIYLGDLDAAEAPIFRALSISPQLSEVQNTIGEFHWARGLTLEARTAWARAVELDPNNPDALTNYAISRWYAREVDGLEDLYRRAVEVDPLNLERYSTFGAFLAFEDHFEATRKLIDRMEQLFNSAAAYSAIAELHEFLGDIDKSIAWTLRARELEPDNPSLVQKLAEYYVDIGEQEIALRLDPNGIGILFKIGRYQEMIELAEYAMIDVPEDLLLRSLLAIAYNATEQYPSAIHILSMSGLPDSVFKGLRSTVEMKGYGALMNALYGAGELELARELAHYRIYVLGRLEGNNWAFTVASACDHAILGEDDKAKSELRDALLALYLPWDPVLKDAPCFRRFANDPDYQATIRHFDEHRALLRARLPITLAEFGVKL